MWLLLVLQNRFPIWLGEFWCYLRIIFYYCSTQKAETGYKWNRIHRETMPVFGRHGGGDRTLSLGTIREDQLWKRQGQWSGSKSNSYHSHGKWWHREDRDPEWEQIYNLGSSIDIVEEWQTNQITFKGNEKNFYLGNQHIRGTWFFSHSEFPDYYFITHSEIYVLLKFPSLYNV